MARQECQLCLRSSIFRVEMLGSDYSPALHLLGVRRGHNEQNLLSFHAVLSYVFRQTALYYGTAGAPVILAIKHIQGGNQWKALLAGKKPTGGEQGPE